MYTLELQGVLSFLAGLEVAPAELDAANFAAMELSVRTVEAEAKSRVPVKTGRLRASIDGNVGFGIEGLEGRVGTKVAYGQAVEYGTSAHEIAPTEASALRFEIGGSAVFAEAVQHPGTRGTGFLGNALNFAEPLIKEYFHDAAKAIARNIAVRYGGWR